ncbi:hypothetical protein HY642_07425 [Candidatus Woesearchaeota archaeon]|nr:hypothetical protein [Candidatus Woesearchaeota archaeon]
MIKAIKDDGRSTDQHVIDLLQRQPKMRMATGPFYREMAARGCMPMGVDLDDLLRELIPAGIVRYVAEEDSVYLIPANDREAVRAEHDPRRKGLEYLALLRENSGKANAFYDKADERTQRLCEAIAKVYSAYGKRFTVAEE